MTVIDDNTLGVRMLRMWDSGMDTAQIAMDVHKRESDVCRVLGVLRAARRQERIDAAIASLARVRSENSPATS